MEEVTNQAPALVDYDAFETDLPLKEALAREGASWALARAKAAGRRAGSAEYIRHGFLANENTPKLKTHDRFGNRIDEVDFHPSWHEIMRTAVREGLHSLPWREPREGAHVARAALYFLYTQMEQGTACPITMTYACIPALRANPSLANEWEPRILSEDYDSGALIGMGMTEKQGGSDVRANTTRAVPAGAKGEYALTGHKWFFSAPMCKAFLVLAQAPGGLSCFLVPRTRPDGSKNSMEIQRLKDKLGNKSNASSEMEFKGAWARLVGEEGRGVPTIIEMVHHTRLDCVIGSAAILRQGLVQAAHHAHYRSAFGKKLIDQPLMRNVLSDLAIESEAATVLFMRLARAFDRRAAGDAAEGAFARFATGVSKFWVCKRLPPLVFEAMECIGGNGYVEESIMPRLYREAPLNSIWEGCGNINALDMVRAARKEPDSMEAFLAELHAARGADRRLDAFTAAFEKDLDGGLSDEAGARRLASRAALALQASLLARHAPGAVSDAFCASRLAGDWGHVAGTLPPKLDLAPILARAWSER
jgi:putative acyl-CoA dehydrogenase